MYVELSLRPIWRSVYIGKGPESPYTSLTKFLKLNIQMALRIPNNAYLNPHKRGEWCALQLSVCAVSCPMDFSRLPYKN